jgi:ubiquinone/menaquinone biosynthesis C-methylase UbiE
MSDEETFGKEFFDGGKKEPWFYRNYSFDEHYPLFQLVSLGVKMRFNPKKVLDVGCAKGFLVKAFKDQGIEAWGVDVSEYALSTAPEDVREHLYRVDLNKDALPFADGYFDCVTFLGTIECLDDYNKILNEIRRVMQPGGGLYLRTAYRTDPADTIRKNVHNRGYWLKEFRRYGFKFLPTWEGPLANKWSYGTLLFERR